jgi:3-methylfumaryl-CoA hydratase
MTQDPDPGQVEPSVRTEMCSVGATRRVAAMLDLDPAGVTAGNPLPPSWHFILLGAETRRCELRSDGFPGLGVPMPDLDLPRLLATGRTVEYHQPSPVGATVERTSAIRRLERKSSGTVPKVAVMIGHELRIAGASEVAIAETQSFLMLGRGSGYHPDERAPRAVTAPHLKTVLPDEILLFQFSALGFNSHRIHSDKTYARDVEGYPDLVVNGGLTALLMTEFARTELGLVIRRLRMKNLAPLFCRRSITLTADQDGPRWRLRAHDERGTVAAEMELETA